MSDLIRPAGPPPLESNPAVARLAEEAAIWSVPIVSFDAMRQAFFRDLGARYGDFGYLSGFGDWRFQVTTPNASTHYVYFNFNLKDGPVVLELPAAEGAGLFGSLLDAWQVPIADVGPAGADRGRGGRYLILPPDSRGEVPPQFLPVPCDTVNGYGIFRAIEEGQDAGARDRAIALAEQLRLYSLFDAADPPPSRHIDMSGILFDGIMRFDESYFASLARMIDEEEPLDRDCGMLTRVKALGVEKGKPFAPDESLRAVLRDGAAAAQSRLIGRSADEGEAFWPDRQWRSPSPVGARTGFTFDVDGRIDVDARAQVFFSACAPPKTLGKATYYLFTCFDGAGGRLTGDARYRLHVPAEPPARQFWALTVYDCATAAFIRDAAKVEINSYQPLARNADGSVDLLLGGPPPAIAGANHLPTGRDWFAMFRFYGPTRALFDRAWTLPDIERVG